MSPRRRRLALYARFHRDKNIRAPEVVAFLQQVLRHLHGPVVLLWDRSRSHRGVLVRAFLLRHPRLHVESFPGYAPELNPDECVWNHSSGPWPTVRPETSRTSSTCFIPRSCGCGSPRGYCGPASPRRISRGCEYSITYA